MTEIDLDRVLYGADPTERIVAVEPEGETKQAILFVRGKDNSTTRQAVPFIPWLLCETERYFAGSTTTKLDGAGHPWRIDFVESGWHGFLDARRALRDNHLGVVSYGSQAKQFLVVSGITLFKGMAFDDLRRMQIDIETTTLFANQPGARIFMVSLSDNTGHQEVLADPDEAALLSQLIARVQVWDPDVIEGHHFYGFDLPWINARCNALGIACALGRGGVPISVGQERNCAIGTNSRPFTPYYVYGRHVIDTLFGVQRFDWSRGQISSYGLKECAQVYKIAPQDRVYLDRREILQIFERDPERVKRYAAQDVEETCALSALVTPSEFYQTQMVPDTYQSLAVTGTGEKVNCLLVREYLRQGVAVPMQKSSKEYPGGYTEVRVTGVISPIVKADVESLYPSLMLTQRIKPASDTLDIFLPLLSELTARRLAAKAQARVASKGTREHAYWDGLQNSYKTLINSFYGYIGGPFYFNDYDAARAVTVAGQEIVKRIADELEATGSQVVEIDTDGVYFRPPDGICTEDDELAYIERIGKTLPDGIRLAHDGHYKAMLSLKIKNYVLEEESGHKIFKGSSLRSRADEPYGRRFLTEAVSLLLAGEEEELSDLYKRTLVRIEEGMMPIDDLARRERVTAKMLSSEQRKRAADAVKSAGIKEGDIVLLYERADKTLALKEEYAYDEDRDYYANKLYKFAGRLKEALPEEKFDRLFPKPVSAAKRLEQFLQPALFEF
ncbi:MAG TPA: DNA polymerase domain-containing protein [Capsulimonadaceae bacterium]|nr:DNA polymerase domain-containing protein [Capsulimonadaceae bacterium]